MPIQYIAVINDKGKRGKVTGLSNCTKKGCTGLRVNTTWPDGSRTRPCSHGHLAKIPGTDGDWRLRGIPVTPH